MSSSQAASKPRSISPQAKSRAGAVFAECSLKFTRVQVALPCCSCGYLSPTATPNWARASRIRIPAMRSDRFCWQAVSTRSFNTGSSNAVHHVLKSPASLFIFGSSSSIHSFGSGAEGLKQSGPTAQAVIRRTLIKTGSSRARIELRKCAFGRAFWVSPVFRKRTSTKKPFLGEWSNMAIPFYMRYFSCFWFRRAHHLPSILRRLSPMGNPEQDCIEDRNGA